MTFSSLHGNRFCWPVTSWNEMYQRGDVDPSAFQEGMEWPGKRWSILYRILFTSHMAGLLLCFSLFLSFLLSVFFYSLFPLLFALSLCIGLAEVRGKLRRRLCMDWAPEEERPTPPIQPGNKTRKQKRRKWTTIRLCCCNKLLWI